MKVIVYDFEVFRHDTLLGAVVTNERGEVRSYLQTWDTHLMQRFYEAHREDVWVGHNNSGYDDYILDAVVHGRSPYRTSQAIIRKQGVPALGIQLYSYDLMNRRRHPGKLKAIECADGKNIHETDVDFDIDRQLTDDERKLEEGYNMSDLEQTCDDLAALADEFALRTEMIEEFNLPKKCYSYTESTIAAMVLGVDGKNGVGSLAGTESPCWFPNLKVESEDFRRFYEEGGVRGKSLELMLCGVPHYISGAGIHAGVPRSHWDWAYYIDVSGYYALIMILYDLLPRTLDEKAKATYVEMYQRQLELKKTNPVKRAVYKSLILSVFGSMLNEHTAFYDPDRFYEVMAAGQAFLVDLLEKLDGKVDLIQSNTDGIIVRPKDGTDIKPIVEEWCDRTGFSVSFQRITDIHQRDVNCYCYRDEGGKIVSKGDIKYYDRWENTLLENCQNAKEPPIFSHIVVEYFMSRKPPEETVEENKRRLRMFQYVVSNKSFDWLELQTEYGNGQVGLERLQNVNRAFARRDGSIASTTVYRCRAKGSKARYPSLPPKVIIWNGAVDQATSFAELRDAIDWDYYIEEGYKKIRTFIDLVEITGVNPPKAKESQE